MSEAAGAEELPLFRYHPDPLGSGSIAESTQTCDVCLRARGFVYTGPVYSKSPEEPRVCPWCLADGAAARELFARFTDFGPGLEAAPDLVRTEVLTRTPGFLGWQQEQWLGHCEDAAVFLGPVGAAELAAMPPAARDALRRDVSGWGGWSVPAVEEYLDSLSRHGEPTGYLFRCRHCGIYLGYSDFT